MLWVMIIDEIMVVQKTGYAETRPNPKNYLYNFSYLGFFLISVLLENFKTFVLCTLRQVGK